jgi:hypothetical protein
MVDKNTIKQALKDLQEELKSETDSEKALDRWAELLSIIIKDAILSADVQAGITVATAGSAFSQTGATTGTGTLL